MHACLYVLLATLFFSSMEVALKGMVGIVSALQVNVIRFFVGGVVLLPLALISLRRHKCTPTLHDLLSFLGLGFVGIVVSMGMYQLAVEEIPANVVAVLFCCNTVFVFVFSHLFLRTPLTVLHLVALGLALLGIVFILEPWQTPLSLQGTVLGLLAPLCFALYAVLGVRRSQRFGAIAVTCFSFLCGSCELLLLLGLGHMDLFVPWLQKYLPMVVHVSLFQGIDRTVIWHLLYVSVGVSGLGFACYFLAAEEASPLVASIAFFLKPVLAPLLCAVLLHEPLRFFLLVGMALIVAGSLCLLFEQRRCAQKKGA